MFYDPQDWGAEILIAFVIISIYTLIVIALLSGELIFPKDNEDKKGD